MSKLRHPETRAFIVVTVMLTTLLAVCGLMIPGKAFAYAADQAGSEMTQVAQVGAQKGSSSSVASLTSQEASQQPVGDSATQAFEAETVRPGGSTSAVSDQELALSSSESASSVMPSADQGPDGSSESSTEPTQPADLPKLTGFVIVSGNTKVGNTLAAGVEGAPEGVSLAYQWYRGESAIPGATANAYTTTIADNGKDITCRVSASGYEGVLVSGAIRPLSSNQSISVEYWGYTDASPEAQVLLKSETANLTDVFDYKYDQNFDTDKTNDRVAYKLLGWQAEGMSGYYDASLPETEFSTTLQDIAALVGWSDNAPLVFHAVQEVRQITVYYWGYGYEDDHYLEPVKVMSWFDFPYIEGIEWKGHRLLGLYDDYCTSVDETMTCGYILSESLGDPWLNELNIFLDWFTLTYTIDCIGPDGLVVRLSCLFENQLELPIRGSISDYPGCEFVGWFTEPKGAGVQVHDGFRYCDIEPDDQIENRSLYAFFKELAPPEETEDQAFAVYSKDDRSLRFYKRPSLPVVGDVFEGKTVTELYTGFEEEVYEREAIPWKGPSLIVTNISVVDTGIKPVSTAFWFMGFNNCTTIDLSRLDTSRVTVMNNMFASCIALDSLNISGFDTSYVTNMELMFANCRNLSQLDLSGFNTSNVTNMASMFNSCSGLTSLNISSFNTSNVADMSRMFHKCSGLTALDLKNFDTSCVTEATNMFYGCSNMVSVNVSSFDTSQMINMGNMFTSCSSLVTLDISNFDYSSATRVTNMLDKCTSLTSVDIGSFDLIRGTSVGFFFGYCTNLTTIYTSASKDLLLGSIAESDMFHGCENLIGGLGTKFDSSQTNRKYACVDGLGGKPGYFTPKITVSYYDPETGTTSTPVSYIYGLKAAESAVTSFFGWSLTPDAAEIAFLPGEVITYDPTDVKDIVLYPVLMPALTGVVVISGDPNVGQVLSAVVNGVQADALLKCQWYRGESPIEGATSAAYTLVGEDRGSVITCRVSASNYRGTILSNTLGPITHLVTVEYWSYTDASPNDYVIVHSEIVDLNSVFNHKFDQNKDDDPTNDYIWYWHRGWYDEWLFEYYDSAIPEDEFSTTIAEIASLVDWDGTSNISMYSAMDPRFIEVTYDAGEFAEVNPFETVRYIPWDLSPYYSGLRWGQHRLVNQTDELGNEIDSNMTCAFILSENIGDPWRDTLLIHINWEDLDYKVRLVYPDGSEDIQHVKFAEKLTLPTDLGSLERPDYEFKGWFTDQNGNGRQVTNDMTYAHLAEFDTVEEVILYAVWEPVVVEVQYWGLTDAFSDDCVLLDTTHAQQIDSFNGTIDQSSDEDPAEGSGFEYPGYEFVGWFSEENGADKQVPTGTTYGVPAWTDSVEEIKLYARFRQLVSDEGLPVGVAC